MEGDNFSIHLFQLIAGGFSLQLVGSDMGCGASSSSTCKDKITLIQLSAAQKYLVRETWETVELHKNAVGKRTFLK